MGLYTDNLFKLAADNVNPQSVSSVPDNVKLRPAAPGNTSGSANKRDRYQAYLAIRRNINTHKAIALNMLDQVDAGKLEYGADGAGNKTIKQKKPGWWESSTLGMLFGSHGGLSKEEYDSMVRKEREDNKRLIAKGERPMTSLYNVWDKDTFKATGYQGASAIADLGASLSPAGLDRGFKAVKSWADRGRDRAMGNLSGVFYGNDSINVADKMLRGTSKLSTGLAAVLAGAKGGQIPLNFRGGQTLSNLLDPRYAGTSAIFGGLQNMKEGINASGHQLGNDTTDHLIDVGLSGAQRISKFMPHMKAFFNPAVAATAKGVSWGASKVLPTGMYTAGAKMLGRAAQVFGKYPTATAVGMGVTAQAPELVGAADSMLNPDSPRNLVPDKDINRAAIVENAINDEGELLANAHREAVDNYFNNLSAADREAILARYNKLLPKNPTTEQKAQAARIIMDKLGDSPEFTKHMASAMNNAVDSKALDITNNRYVDPTTGKAWVDLSPAEQKAAMAAWQNVAPEQRSARARQAYANYMVAANNVDYDRVFTDPDLEPQDREALLELAIKKNDPAWQAGSTWGGTFGKLKAGAKALVKGSAGYALENPANQDALASYVKTEAVRLAKGDAASFNPEAIKSFNEVYDSLSPVKRTEISEYYMNNTSAQEQLKQMAGEGTDAVSKVFVDDCRKQAARRVASGDAKYTRDILTGFKQLSGDGGALADPEALKPVVETVLGMDVANFVNNASLEDLKNIQKALAGDGTGSNLLKMFPEAEVKKFTDKVDKACKAKIWDAVQDNPFENLPVALNMWLTSMGAPGLGDFFGNKAGFYGTLLMLLFGGGMLLSGGDSDDRDDWRTRPMSMSYADYASLL